MRIRDDNEFDEEYWVGEVEEAGYTDHDHCLLM